MMSENAKVIKLAKMAADMMVTDIRDNGEKFVKFSDNRPQWMQDLSRHAHDGMMPDDWKYEFIRQSLNTIADADEDADLDELMYEIKPNVYYGELLKWLSSNLIRAGYCDDHMGEGSDLFAVIQMGQQDERQEVYTLVLSFLRDLADEMEDEEEEE